MGTRSPHPGRIPSLDGLRAVSILFVMAGHALGGRPHSFIFRCLFLHAGIGVTIFFIISGFLITSLMLEERSRFGDIDLLSFYIRRSLRILPAFCVYSGCIAALSVLGLVFVPRRFWVNVATYTVNFSRSRPHVLEHLWSLSVEEQFYLLWPLVVRFGRPRTWTTVAIAAILAGPACHALHRITGFQPAPYAFPLVCGPLAMGCLLGLTAARVRNRITSSKFLSDPRALLATVVGVILMTTVSDHDGAVTVLLNLVAQSLLTLAIARCAFVTKDSVARLLNSAPLVWIGKLSYSLYLWQQLFLLPVLNGAIAAFPTNLLATVAAASSSYLGVEVRFSRLRSRFRNRRPRAVCAGVVAPGLRYGSPEAVPN